MPASASTSPASPQKCWRRWIDETPPAGKPGVTAAPRFARFAAIDWSGARGERHKGIAIAVADAGNAAPALLRPGHIWSRTETLDWLRTLGAGPPTLVGMDFSFAPPFVLRRSYLPGDTVPDDARAFWAFVDSQCDDDDLGAASFLEQRFRRHFYFGKADGRKADFMHYRRCEAAFNAAGGGNASTVYDAIGAAQVAKASFAGMRVLHRIGDRLPVWPFDAVAKGSLLVEIYCRSFIRLAGLRGMKIRTRSELDGALAALGSAPASDSGWLNDNQTDALVAAAGLRSIAADGRYWLPRGLTPEIAFTEGWTFGVG